MRQVQLTLEGDMQLLCVTGVEDKLQPDVRTTLELLANAGIKVRYQGNKVRNHWNKMRYYDNKARYHMVT